MASKHEAWGKLFAKTLEASRPELWEELTKRGPGFMDEFIGSRVDEAIQNYQQYLESGSDEQEASELALADLLQQDEDETEEWELEDGRQEQANLLFNHWGITPTRVASDEDEISED